ncbi:hypothetical protein GCM10010121_093010 [Streptomyces brasiliensis]|uniref:Mutator family transposase n=1 Tax=Streptomyces brasiliensis TaxID=1954 RepID=A0A917P9H0_9ACTN|nr:transposase [Streptomyces brasiliensis]GGJ67686.1 hypothetical protein GCM10010121_093010 [Streptomyces brasiliensis]
MDGCKDVLGLWVGDEGEGATTWISVLSELRNRGVEDVCIVACDCEDDRVPHGTAAVTLS